MLGVSFRDEKTLETFRAIEREILDAEELDEAERYVLDFRAKYADGVWSAERAWLALQVAYAHFRTRDLDESRIWVLRALLDGPRIDALCLLGTIYAEMGDAGSALRWYEAACAMSDPPPATSTEPQPRYAMEDLIAQRNERLVELRQKVYGDIVEVRRVRRGHSPHHVFAVQSAPRSTPFLQGLVDSLGRQWSGRPQFLWFDSKEIGSVRAFRQLLEQVTEKWPYADAITVLEDDVRLADGACEYIASTKIDDDLAFLSWFAVDDAYPGPALIVRPVKDFSGSQAITLPIRTVRAILASSLHETWPHKHLKDSFVSSILVGASFGIHHPHVVQHVGGISSAMDNNRLGPRVSRDFVEDVASLVNHA